MALNSIDAAENVGLDSRDNFEVSTQSTKTGEQKIEFEKNHWYFRQIPEVNAVINRLALWVIYGGDDFIEEQKDIKFATKSDEIKFKRITGYGKDTPEDVFANLFKVGKLCGCSVGEIIKDRANKKGLINLKPIDPETIIVRANKFGILESFEQISLKAGADGMQIKPLKFKPEDIFYVAWDRIADEIVGTSTIEKLEKIIDYKHQTMEDLGELYHRYVVPFWLFYVDTDDDAEVAEFKKKVKKMIENKDHMVVPKDVVDKHERISLSQTTLNPLDWIQHLEKYFLMSEGVPELIMGAGKGTAESSSRMVYLAWRIVAIANQKIYEKHIKMQLGIDLKFPRPTNILPPEITRTKTEIPARE